MKNFVLELFRVVKSDQSVVIWKKESKVISCIVYVGIDILYLI
jgi:hypothetical protein